MNFFQNCQTVEEIKTLYRQLARQHHPDLGGDLKTMQRLNDEYDKALKGCNGQKTVKNGKEYTYTYDADIEGKIKEVIETLIGLNMPNVEIWLIGLWVWVEGETKPHKEQLKALGLRWHSKRGCWYFAGKTSGYRRSSGKGIDDIAQDYGATKFAKNQRKKLG